MSAEFEFEKMIDTFNRERVKTDEERWDEVDPEALIRYYARDGRQISMREWTTKFEDRTYKRVAETNCGFHWVSTVWLGLDHSMRPFRSGLPVIFETMVFARTEADLRNMGVGFGLHDHYAERYSTEADALAGHARIVAALEASTLEMSE